jgi:hypothetical protein
VLDPILDERGRQIDVRLADSTFAELADPDAAVKQTLAWLRGSDDDTGAGLVSADEVAWLKTQFPTATFEEDLIARRKIQNRKGGGYPAGTKIIAATMDTVVGIYVVDDATVVFFDPSGGPTLMERENFFSWAIPRTLDMFLLLAPVKK